MDNEAIREMFDSLGEVTIKRMFGGKGIYHQGRILALEISAGDLLLKADAESAPAFEAAGARQWVYEGKARSKPVAMPYWTIPEDALDDPDELAKWVALAWGAALRAKK